jgi:hypothetical protein
MTFDAVKLNILRLKGTPNGQLSNLESLCAGSFAGEPPPPHAAPTSHDLVLTVHACDVIHDGLISRG